MSKKINISPDVLSQQVSGEVVLLDMKSEQYFGLNEVGARFWQLIQENSDFKTTIESLQQEYDVEFEILNRDLESLTKELEQAGLISINP